jgi:hypothetical protein
MIGDDVETPFILSGENKEKNGLVNRVGMPR